jgi:cytochrome c oxidase subunit 2
MFEGLSNIANHVDAAMLYIIGISLILLVGITGTMLYFVFRYSKKRNPEAEEVSGHLGLEITWTILPTILVIFIFWVGYSGYELMRDVPSDNLPVKVTARQWSWLFTYENGKSSDKLVVPMGRAIKLSIFSDDVLHSLFIPAFRVKEDAVPGMETKLWFIPQKAAEYDLFCTEYCGVGHASMITKVKVLTPDEFDKWYSSTGPSGAEKLHRGEQLLRDKGCLGCHTTDGTKLIGPSFKGLMGSTVTVITGGKESTVTADSEYIERSIK